MHGALKFFSFAATTLVLSLSSTQPIIGTTINAGADNSLEKYNQVGESLRVSQVLESVESGNNYLQKLQNREIESANLLMQSLAYLKQGNFRQSRQFAEQSLSLTQEIKKPLMEALAFLVLSLNDRDSGNYQNALELINKSLSIAREQNNRELQALTLEIQGEIYRKAGQREQAISSYQEAISINDSFSALAGVARVYQEANLLQTAITYYKLAVNRNEQQTYRLIPGLLLSLQESLIPALQDINGLQTVVIYRSLASSLLSEKGKLEAQQVLELLKAQELREYTGNTIINTTQSGESPSYYIISPGKSPSLTFSTPASVLRRERVIQKVQPTSLPIAATEQQIIKEYGSIIEFGKKVDECQQTRCPELESLLAQRQILTKQYYQTIGQLETVIHNKRASDEAFIDPTNQFTQKAQQIVEAEPGTVLIYPLVLPDRIWLLWASKGGIFKSLEVKNVTQPQLEATVLSFRQLLQNRLSNINTLKATSKQLYDWLIKPLEKELKDNNIHNLVFALDRSTRYVPMSTLFDGEKYLIENYSVSTVLSANLTETRSKGGDARSERLSNKQNTTVLALGLSDAVAGFPPLPNVPAELDTIVRLDAGEAKGIYPGQEFLNKSFNFLTLRNNLSGHQILHIATHGQFVPGKANQSFLVLGTGEKLEIPDIETWLDLHNINLAVLSACQTALGGPGEDGREISGVGYYFLKSGAKTVMASLWQVNDLSTRLLMEEFYKNLAKGTTTSPARKAEALRLAQLAMLNGIEAADTRSQSHMPAPSSQQAGEQQGNIKPPVVRKRFFRHPYYWAPFILMGSGQ